MTTEINTGGPAFPSEIDYGECGKEFHLGMSLRDWFAGQALAGLAGSYGGLVIAAGDAYRLADAMLAARGAKP